MGCTGEYSTNETLKAYGILFGKYGGKRPGFTCDVIL
jgi:hypothetical protein